MPEDTRPAVGVGDDIGGRNGGALTPARTGGSPSTTSQGIWLRTAGGNYMDGDVGERAAAAVERETGAAVESTHIVEQLTTGDESALVIAVETADGGETYWVVEDGTGATCYSPETHQTADALLTEHMTNRSR